MLATAWSVLFFSHTISGGTDVTTFFIATVFVPLLFSAVACGITGKSFRDLIGLRGDILLNIGMIALTAGATVLLYMFLIRPFSLLFKGTSIYPAILWTTAVFSQQPAVSYTPLLLILVTYIWVGFGEEIIKLFGMKSIAQTISKFTRISLGWCFVIGGFLSFLFWVLLHMFAWSAGEFFIAACFAIFWSVFWYTIFYVAGERFIAPEAGIQPRVMILSGPAAGHAIYDVLSEMGYQGYLTGINSSFILLIGAAAFAIGVGIVIYQWYRYPRLTWF